MSMDVKTVTTYETTGAGVLTAGKLAEILANMPADTPVSITATSDQREGDWWRVIGRKSS